MATSADVELIQSLLAARAALHSAQIAAHLAQSAFNELEERFLNGPADEDVHPVVDGFVVVPRVDPNASLGQRLSFIRVEVV